MFKRLFFVLAAVIGAASLVQAQSLELGFPQYGGNGCPQGSASVAMSPDNQQLSIIFDQYMAQAEGRTRLDRKTCNISIPVKIPQGWSVAIFGVDYRGFNSLPRGAQSVFTAEYFYAGMVGRRLNETFRGPLDRDFLIHHDIVAESLVWSACGANTVLRANTSIRAQTNSHGDLALATVDSADVNAALIYQLQWKRCR